MAFEKGDVEEALTLGLSWPALEGFAARLPLRMNYCRSSVHL